MSSAPSPLAVPRDLRLLAGAVFLSAAGDLLALIVLALHVHELTGSGLAVSALFATTLVPVVALAPLAGLVADRFESVRVLVAASLAQALAAAALAFTGDLATILVLSSLLTAGNAFSQPAEFPLIGAAAGSRPVTKATGIVEAARYAGFAAGPVMAAVLAALGPRPALLLNAVSFLAIAAAVGAMRARRPPCRGRPCRGVRIPPGRPYDCSKRSFVRAGVSGTLSLKPLVKKPLKVKTKITVIVSKPGAVSAVKVLSIRARKEPRITTLCLPPGAAKPSACK